MSVKVQFTESSLLTKTINSISQANTVSSIWVKTDSHGRESVSSCNFVEKETLGQVFSCGFVKFPRTPFLQNTSGQLLLHFMTFSNWEYLPQYFKTFAVGKSAAVSIIVYRNILSNFWKPPSGTAKAIAIFKETTNCKIPQAVGAYWTPETDFSLFHAFRTIH